MPYGEYREGYLTRGKADLEGPPEFNSCCYIWGGWKLSCQKYMNDGIRLGGSMVKLNAFNGLALASGLRCLWALNDETGMFLYTSS